MNTSDDGTLLFFASALACWMGAPGLGCTGANDLVGASW